MAIQKPSHTFTKIHLKELQTNIFQILFTLSFTVFINTFSYAQDVPRTKPIITPDVSKDTIKISLDSLQIKPINTKEQDSITLDSIPKKKSLLEDIMIYKAIDYTSINQNEKKIYLYNEAQMFYLDMEIKAGIIVIDYAKNEVTAKGIVDSLGNYTQAPIFKQRGDVVEPDSMIMNTVTKKTIIYNSKIEQKSIDGVIFAEISKKENDSVIFINRAKFTTSDDPDNPEYYFLMRKVKIVPGKKVVAGLTNLYIADVPTPIGLPFAFFPLTKKRTSGVIFPSFGEDSSRGYNIQNGGYYFAISEYADLAVLGDYYTNGSYGLRLQSAYVLRYKFRGNLSFRFENLITSERGFPDYAKSTIYNLRWSHSQDGKSNPSSRFSASVNLGSSTYYQQSVNQLNSSNFLNNTLSSSISYSKTFKGQPQVNISFTATHSQNTNTESISMTLPTFQASVDRVYPFAPKVGSKKGFIQNINLQYNIRGENRIQTTDSLFFKKEMFDDAKIGMQHTIPISTNFKVLKYISISTSANYQETWVLKTVDKTFDEDSKEVITTEINGFDSFRTYNFSVGLGTTVYGMFDFGEDKKIQAIRHIMRPSISYNISPSFDKYYDTYEVIDADGTLIEEVDFTRFEESIFGAPGNNYSSSIGLSLGNNFEAKVRDKDSTATEAKKIILLNNLNLSTSYNIAGDSLNWSPLRITGGTQILDNKMSINFGATLDPYALDNNNNKINTFNISNGGSLFRLTSANLTMNYTLTSKSFDKSKNDNQAAREESLRSGGRDDDLFGVPQDFSDQLLNASTKEPENEETSELYSYKMPWSLRLAYSVNYSNTRRQNEISSHSLMVSGDIDISPRWSIGASSGYDLKSKGITYTQLRFERDLLSWRMNFSWIPFSSRSSWNFFIGIRSPILKDLKYDKRKTPDRRL
ncbi:LPS-assembly protein LptD [Flavobacteriaceae bacterium PRS1]|nr:LPS-assembly protein LptD [Flavobacteriaceae bacterium PRS1]